MNQLKFLLLFPVLVAQIYGLGNQSIIVNKPGGGAIWSKGLPCQAATTIEWSLDPRIIRRLRNPAFFKYDIELYKPDGSLVSQVATHVSGFNYCWHIPENLPEGNYRIKILTPDRVLSGESQVFQITEK
ncbi:MAG TPA: hypothetical protein VNM22_18970 [Candidatus Limnocylindrales bacterium]|nr:hypothetical protein [Candidatus Limnocylindrales bacterium]